MEVVDDMSCSKNDIKNQEIIKQHNYDVFVVYDEEDHYTQNELVPKLRQEGIRCCTIDENGELGKIIIDIFEYLLNKSRKVLFVASKLFMNNLYMDLFSSLALKHKFGNIITMVTDGQILYRLRSTIIIHKTKEDWWDDLMKEVNTIVPEYCHFLNTGKTSDLLLLRGLCAITFECELYGILIVASDKIFKINLEEYSEHRSHHRKYGIREVCSKCNWLNHADTTVSVVMNKGFLADSDQKTLRGDLAQFCVSVMYTAFPVCSPEKYRSLTCAVDGQYDEEEQEFISCLFQETRFDLLIERTRKQIDPSFPQFSTFKKRRESYPDSWHDDNILVVEKLCDAGFYYTGMKNNVQCYFCGLCLFIKAIQEKNLDPFDAHTKLRPSCKHIRDKVTLSLDEIDRSFLRGKHEARIQTLTTLEERKSTYHVIDVEDNNFGIKNETERENLAEKLGNAGFYFFGHNSVIGCFCCGLSLAFEPSMNETDPWNIHAILSSKCEFLIKQKGHEFVELIQSSRKLGMSQQTVVTFMWSVFARHKRKNPSDLMFRPCSKIAFCLNDANKK